MANIEKSWPMTVSVYMYYILFFILLFSVFRNGDLLCPPFRFIIPRSMRQDLEQILSLVTEKVSLRTGAVRRWVTLTDTVTNTYKQREKSSRWNKTTALHQVVLSGRSDCVLSRWAGDRPLLCCCGNREIQETSICGAAGLKSYREVLLCAVLCECVCVKMCVFFASVLAVLLSRVSDMREYEQYFSAHFYLSVFWFSLFCRYYPGKRRLLRRNEVPSVNSVIRLTYFKKKTTTKNF